MMRALLLILLFCPVWSSASSPFQATLAQMAERADHIIGTVTGVDMVDAQGRPITDPGAMTGSAFKDVIRLRIRISKVLVTNAAHVPESLCVPLDPFMHFSLGQIREEESGKPKPRLLMLKGPAFQPVLAGVFARPLSDKAEALRLHALKR